MVATRPSASIKDLNFMLFVFLGGFGFFGGAEDFAGVLASDMDGLPVMNDGKNFFAHANEFGFRLHFTRIAVG